MGVKLPRATRLMMAIRGRTHWLWRAVDQDGYGLDEIVQTRRNTKAAKRLLIRPLKKQGLAPKRIITDKLRSYGAAKRDVIPAVEHRSHKGLNNRAENSHLNGWRRADVDLLVHRHATREQAPDGLARRDQRESRSFGPN